MFSFYGLGNKVVVSRRRLSSNHCHSMCWGLFLSKVACVKQAMGIVELPHRGVTQRGEEPIGSELKRAVDISCPDRHISSSLV